MTGKSQGGEMSRTRSKLQEKRKREMRRGMREKRKDYKRRARPLQIK